MLLALRSFMGIAPKHEPRRLVDSAAQIARNCDLRNGILRALRGVSPVFTLPKPGTHRTVYRFGQSVNDETLYWFHWTDDVDVVKGQIATDVDERTFFSGDSTYGHPRVTKASIALVPAATGNLVNAPTDFTAAGWTNSTTGGVANPVVTPNTVAAPDGTMTADQIDFPATSGSQECYRRFAISGLNNPETIVNGIWLRAPAPLSIRVRAASGATDFVTLSVTTTWQFFPLAGGPRFGGVLNFDIGQEASQPIKTIYVWGATVVLGTTALDWRVAVQGYPLQSYRLGVPAPASPPTSGGIGGSGAGTAETRLYIYTYVTGDGEEGQPSLPLEVDGVLDGQSVTLNNLIAAPAGYNITSKRIYRLVQTIGGGNDYQFIAQITDATTSYIDTKLAIDLAEVCPSLEWEMPPATLRGLVNLPNGIMAGFDGLDVLFSEPYRPFAWPSKYRQPVDYPVVGLGAYDDTLVVCTRGVPYLMWGADSASIVTKKLQLAEACVSKRGILSGPGGVMYPSPNGLCRVGPGGAALVTEDIIDKEFWTSLNPSSIEAYLYDNRYIGIYNNGSLNAFQFDPDDPNQPFSLIPSLAAVAGFNDRVMDALYLNIGGTIHQWDEGSTPYTYTWRSKVFESPKPLNFGWAKVEADAYPVQLSVYSSDDNPSSGTYQQRLLRYTVSVANRKPFRLPSGFLSSDWEIELSGTNKVTAAFLSTSASELQQV